MRQIARQLPASNMAAPLRPTATTSRPGRPGSRSATVMPSTWSPSGQPASVQCQLAVGPQQVLADEDRLCAAVRVRVDRPGVMAGVAGLALATASAARGRRPRSAPSNRPSRGRSRRARPPRRGAHREQQGLLPAPTRKAAIWHSCAGPALELPRADHRAIEPAPVDQRARAHPRPSNGRRPACRRRRGRGRPPCRGGCRRLRAVHPAAGSRPATACGRRRSRPAGSGSR